MGINPGLRSEALGHHFAGKGNPFWRLLHASGLLPTPLSFAEDRRLADFGFALTNVAPRATRQASELSRSELKKGYAVLERKIRRLKPRVVVFTGVTIYRQFFPQSPSPGAGLKPELVGGARVFVLPNPSGLNASYPGFRQKLVWFKKLRRFLDRAN